MARTPQTPQPPRTTQSSARLAFLVGGGAWILTTLYFVGQGIAQAAWRTSYSLIDNRVSDLGSTTCGTTVANTYICSPLHAVMNFTFVLTGMPDAGRVVPDLVDLAPAPADHLGSGPAGSGRSWHDLDRTEPGERQCLRPSRRCSEHSGRQRGDDLARARYLA